MPQVSPELGSSTVGTISSPSGAGAAGSRLHAPPPTHGPTRAGGAGGCTSPHNPTRAAGTEGEASPHHVRAAVTAEVTAHCLKRSRPAGPGRPRPGAALATATTGGGGGRGAGNSGGGPKELGRRVLRRRAELCGTGGWHVALSFPGLTAGRPRTADGLDAGSATVHGQGRWQCDCALAAEQPATLRAQAASAQLVVGGGGGPRRDAAAAP